MSAAIFWGLIGSLITAAVALFGIFIAMRTGWLHFGIAKQEHDLNLRKSAPIIGSVVKITERQVNPAPAYDPFYYIVTAIHNYGDLAAQQLKGNWRLYSPDKMITEHDIPIMRDALGSVQYEFQPCQLIGPKIESMIRRGGKVTIHVDIEFDYFGLSKDQPEHYSARYQYDHNSRQMVQIPN